MGGLVGWETFKIIREAGGRVKGGAGEGGKGGEGKGIMRKGNAFKRKEEGEKDMVGKRGR